MAEADASTGQQDRSGQRRSFALVALCFFVSGFAALLYETVWLRQFAILLGTSEQALAVVLASYMGGLAIGAVVAGRVVGAIRRPLLTYGLLELGIAISALLVPLGLMLVGRLQVSWMGGLDQPPDSGGLAQVAFCLLAAFGLILIPTALMGATLPLLARHVVHRDLELGPKIGALYAINTTGAVLGTVVAAFVLMPGVGLRMTTWTGAAANLLVFLLVVLMIRVGSDARPGADASHQSTSPRPNKGDQARAGDSKRPRTKGRKRTRRTEPAETAPDAGTATARYRWVLLLVAASGAMSFTCEIIFTRMLSHLLGGSVFAFATMLAGFLLGIAIGGAIGSRFATRSATAVVGFAYAQGAAALCTLLSYHMVNRMMAWPWESLGGASATPVQVIASILALLPMATCIGATFPLAVRIYARDESQAATASAKVYSWNVFGGIIGAMAAGAVFLPTLQYQGATALAITGNVVVSVATLWLLGAPRVHLAAVAPALVALAAAFPTTPENVLRVSALGDGVTPGEIVFNHVGRSATVTVFFDDGRFRFQTNGLPESMIMPIGSVETYRSTGVWLTALPPLLRADGDSMLLIGLGGGVAAERVPPSVRSVDVMELEPAVLDANAAVSDFRDRDPLEDPRVNIIINDGRNALALTNKKYDWIVSQPSHPWTAGASHLYTREFDTLVRDHLNPGGIFLQWMSTDFVDEELTRSMAATLLHVFDHVRLYQPVAGTLMFVASDRPIEPENVAREGIITGDTIEKKDYYRRIGVTTPTHLFAMLSLDQAGVESIAEGAALITDERNLLAMRGPQLLAAKHDGTRVEVFVEESSPLMRGAAINSDFCPTFELMPFVESKMERGSKPWVRDHLLPVISDPADQAVIKSELVRTSQSSEEWIAFLIESAREFPNREEFAFQIACSAALGKAVDVPEGELNAMRNRLSPTRRMVVNLIAEMVEGKLDTARQRDPELASVSEDDMAFKWAVRVRLPWRLEASGRERVSRGIEALDIIDSSAPFADVHGLAWFRASAAVQARQPLVALGTIDQLCQTISESISDPESRLDGAAVATLARCRNLLADPVPFAAFRQRYQQVLLRTDGILQAASVR